MTSLSMICAVAGALPGAWIGVGSEGGRCSEVALRGELEGV